MVKFTKIELQVIYRKLSLGNFSAKFAEGGNFIIHSVELHRIFLDIKGFYDKLYTKLCAKIYSKCQKKKT